ncbi:MAG: glycosyltransferase [Ignavibacteriales bacterium]|nr:glycosyltransferase [Ignavibacteriales bacterium]
MSRCSSNGYKKTPNVIFLLIGGNLVNYKVNFLEHTKSYIKEKKLEQYFYFVGEVQNPMPYIELFDVGCLISHYEGFGNALVEYMLKRKPVIGTNVGGIKDIIDDGENGFLIPPQNAVLLSEKIIYLLQNSSIAKEMGENGYQKAIREYDMNVWVEKIIKLYQSVL